MKLEEAAQRLTEALRFGDLEQAEHHLAELQRQISLSTSHGERVAAAELVLEARKLARVQRAQTIQALQSLVRQRLYGAEERSAAPTFQLNG